MLRERERDTEGHEYVRWLEVSSCHWGVEIVEILEILEIVEFVEFVEIVEIVEFVNLPHTFHAHHFWRQRQRQQPGVDTGVGVWTGQLPESHIEKRVSLDSHSSLYSHIQ